MAKGKWRKELCPCGTCKKCKDRARLDKKKAGTWVPRKTRPPDTEEAKAARKVAREEARKAKKEA